MKLVGVYGAGGFGREVVHILNKQYKKNGETDVELVIIDDAPQKEHINGYQCLLYSDFIGKNADIKHVAIAIANSNIRQRLVEQCMRDYVTFIQVCADNVIRMDDVIIGEGAILCPFVLITSNTRIGRHFHANYYSYVAHDCVIGDFVTFAPDVKCNGNVLIEDHAYIGCGAILRQGNPEAPLIIGRGAVVGMGAVVTKDVPAGVTVAGNPAKILRKS